MDGFFHYTRAERAVDGGIHAAGIIAALAGIVLLGLEMPWPVQWPVVAALGIYGAGLLAMLLASAAYNAAPDGRAKALLRRLDRAAIFIMIAGTYTPMTVLGLGGGAGLGLLATVWAGALAGVVFSLTAEAWLDRVAIAAYLALGWCGFVLVGQLWAVLTPGAFALLLGGGMLYSLGVVAHQAHRVRFHNAIWHVMVMAGAGCHFALVLLLARAARG